jgi:hypothetical protein
MRCFPNQFLPRKSLSFAANPLWQIWRTRPDQSPDISSFLPLQPLKAARRVFRESGLALGRPSTHQLGGIKGYDTQAIQIVLINHGAIRHVLAGWL